MVPPPEEDAVPEVLEQRRTELAAFNNNLERSGFASLPMSRLEPPADLAMVMGAMRGEVLHLDVGGEQVPVWLGTLVAGSTAVDRLEIEEVAAVCLDALDIGAAEALANRLTAQGLTVLAAPLPAIGSHREPLRRRRAVHRDPAMQARQTHYKARHGLDALIEQAMIPVGDRPVLVRAHLGAIADLVAKRTNLDRVPVIACTEETGKPGEYPPGVGIVEPGHRSPVFGCGSMVVWFFQPQGGTATMRLQMTRIWWDTHGMDGVNRITGWLLALSAQGSAVALNRLEQRLEEALEVAAHIQPL